MGRKKGVFEDGIEPIRYKDSDVRVPAGKRGAYRDGWLRSQASALAILESLGLDPLDLPWKWQGCRVRGAQGRMWVGNRILATARYGAYNYQNTEDD